MRMLIQQKLSAHRDLKSIEIRGNRTSRQFVMEWWKHHSIHYTHNRVMCTCSIAIGAHAHVTHHCNGTYYASLQRHCNDNQRPSSMSAFPGSLLTEGLWNLQKCKQGSNVQKFKYTSPFEYQYSSLWSNTPTMMCVCARAHTCVSVCA